MGLVHSFGLLNIFCRSWKYAYVTKSSGLLVQLFVASFKHVVLGLWFCSFGPSQPVIFKCVRETCFSLSLLKKKTTQKKTLFFCVCVRVILENKIKTCGNAEKNIKNGSVQTSSV